MENQNETDGAVSTAMAEYLAFKERLSKPLATAEQLQRLIADKRDEIARARAAIPDLSALVSKREDLLAERAIGSTVDADITAIDAEIARIEEIAAATEGAIASEEQAITGLQRRLDGVNQEIADLSAGDRENELIAAVLSDHANVLSGEYTSLAYQMKAVVIRLIAVDMLFANLTKKHLGRLGYGPFHFSDFEILACGLDTTSPREGRGSPGRDRLFVARSQDRHEWDAAMEAEQAVLAAVGLKW